MSWTSAVALTLALAGLSPWQAWAQPVCPAIAGQPLRYVDVFDGDPVEMATLMPDVAKERRGHWTLGYVYDARRTVTIRCKYADKQMRDVKLANRVNRCEYRRNSKKALTVSCR